MSLGVMVYIIGIKGDPVTCHTLFTCTCTGKSASNGAGLSCTMGHSNDQDSISRIYRLTDRAYCVFYIIVQQYSLRLPFYLQGMTTVMMTLESTFTIQNGIIQVCILVE